MKLAQFSVNGFRCISGGLEDNSIQFEDNHTTFIFGQNNVGKSSFLKAYQSYYSDDVKVDDFTFRDREGDALGEIEMELWLHIEEDKDKSRINAIANNKYESLTRYLDEGILKVKRVWSVASGKVASKNYTIEPSSGEWTEKNYGGIGLDGVFQALLPKPLFIHAMPSEQEVKVVVNEILKEIANTKLTKEQSEQLVQAQATISELQDKIYDKATIDEYERQVNERFVDLFDTYKIIIDEGTSRLKFTHDKLGKDFEIDFQNSNNGQSTKYSKMGHGAVRMAIFLLMLMSDKLQGEEFTEKTYLVLFEEPELFLHPRLTKKLRQLVYDVSGVDTPFQILCASHSPQMIDMTKDRASIVRMVKDERGTKLHQIMPQDLTNTEQSTVEEVKQKVHEILRFNPYLCESFYADEVVLIEGDTEAIIFRAYLQEFRTPKDIFVVNCGTVNNIPFYQKIFSEFKIPYSVICDTDHILKEDSEGTNRTGWNGEYVEPSFTSHIQKSIAEQYAADKALGLAKKFFVCAPTFEPYHTSLPEPFTYVKSAGGKAVNANTYWEKIFSSQGQAGFSAVPIISYIKSILE